MHQAEKSQAQTEIEPRYFNKGSGLKVLVTQRALGATAKLDQTAIQ
jgi:hypothetical protein